MHFAWMIIFGIAFVAACAVGLRHAFGGPGGTQEKGESPESILKRCYANGEIDRDEFETRLADLRK